MHPPKRVGMHERPTPRENRTIEAEVQPLDLAECFEIVPPIHRDARGIFVKPFSRLLFERYGMESSFAETFYTVSGPNVLRGMHLQLPPIAHAKLISCVAGRILDVALDLRSAYPTYGQFVALELDGDRCNAVYLTHGVAHGFYVLEAPAIVVYAATTVHVPSLDAGVAWNSFGMRWPSENPVISERDASLPPFVKLEMFF